MRSRALIASYLRSLHKFAHPASVIWTSSWQSCRLNSPCLRCCSNRTALLHSQNGALTGEYTHLTPHCRRSLPVHHTMERSRPVPQTIAPTTTLVVRADSCHRHTWVRLRRTADLSMCVQGGCIRACNSGDHQWHQGQAVLVPQHGFPDGHHRHCENLTPPRLPTPR